MLLPFGHRRTTIQTLVTAGARFIGSNLDFESGYLGRNDRENIFLNVRQNQDAVKLFRHCQK
jgi:hypothetical protein